MNRWSLILLFSVFTSGCVSSQVIPKGNLLSSIRTISVVPIETIPLLLHPDNVDDRKAIDIALGSTKNPIGTSAPKMDRTDTSLSPVTFILSPPPVRQIASILVIIGAVATLAEIASAGKEVPGETAVIEKGQPIGIWAPTVELAKRTIDSLQSRGFRTAHLIDGYVKLPITDRSINLYMENWLGPIRRYYNSNISTVNYADVDSVHSDAILEVGIMNYEYVKEGLSMQVFVRLVDPRTKQVLGRVRKHVYSDSGPLATLLRNDAEEMKHLVMETGNHLLVECLDEMGLTTNLK